MADAARRETRPQMHGFAEEGPIPLNHHKGDEPKCVECIATLDLDRLWREPQFRPTAG